VHLLCRHGPVSARQLSDLKLQLPNGSKSLCTAEGVSHNEYIALTRSSSGSAMYCTYLLQANISWALNHSMLGCFMLVASRGMQRLQWACHTIICLTNACCYVLWSGYVSSMVTRAPRALEAHSLTTGNSTD